MNLTITDPAVTLTDYGLAIECLILLGLLARPQASDETLRLWFLFFFAAAAAASLLGGTVHGFFKAADSRGRAILWPLTLLSILLSGLAAWFAAARLELRPRVETWARIAAIALVLILSAAVILLTRNFAIAIVGYLPSTLFLLFALVSTYRRRKDRAIAWGIAGLSLTLVAAGVQRLRIAIHPVYLDHNAFYHVIQGLGFWMIYKSARYLSTVWPPIRRSYAVTT
ncbi:MAG TPA: hypothetical protein VJ865_16405 [Gemmatimonadaceae bacterium]|nr:hypothetical protein [Gemmatimonadaceae bacterium]